MCVSVCVCVQSWDHKRDYTDREMGRRIGSLLVVGGKRVRAGYPQPKRPRPSQGISLVPSDDTQNATMWR